jgi:hypothetical protein
VPLQLDAVRDLLGQRLAVQAGDEGDGHVHARRHAGRGPAVAVLDPARLRHPLDARPLLAGPREGPLVGRGPVAVKQPGRGEQGGARAHRGDQAGASRPAGQPGQEAGVLHERPGAAAAGDEHDVGGRHRFVREVSHYPPAVGAAHGSASGAGQDQAELVGQGAEQLQRAEDVQGLEAVEQDSRNGARGHGPGLSPASLSNSSARRHRIVISGSEPPGRMARVTYRAIGGFT